MPNLFRRIRRRFGIAAPRLTVRTHVAWYWRWLGIIVVAALSLALAAWIYDAGRRYAGYDRGAVEDELVKLRSDHAQLQREAADLHAAANAADARMRIEQSAQMQLATQMKQLEGENARLKEDLAFFEGPNAGEHRDERLTIRRFSVERGAQPGQYRYRLLVMQGGRRDHEFQGSVQIAGEQEKGRNVMLSFTSGDSAGGSSGPGGVAGASQRLGFRFFQRLEGSFQVPAGSATRSVQVRIFENGAGEPRAVQSASLP